MTVHMSHMSHSFPNWAIYILREMKDGKRYAISSILATILTGAVGISVGCPVLENLAVQEIPVIDGNGKDVSPASDEYSKFDENYSYRVLDGLITLNNGKQIRILLILTAIDADNQPVYKARLRGSGKISGNTAYILYTCETPYGAMHWSGVMVMTIPIEGQIDGYFMMQNTKQVGRHLMGTLKLQRRIL